MGYRRKQAKVEGKIEKDIRCPLEYGLEIFGGKWNSRIICVLAAQKTLRYSEFRTVLPQRESLWFL